MNRRDSTFIAGLRRCAAAVRRRVWILVPFALVTPAAAYVVASQDPPIYEASARVLLRTPYDTSGIEGLSVAAEDRTLNTQAQIAAMPDVADRVRRSLAGEAGTRAAVGGTSVSADGETDLLTFRTSARDPEVATRVASEYARQYVAFTTALDTAALRQAAAALGRQLDALRSNRVQNTALYGSIDDRLRLIQTALSAQSANASVVELPERTTKVQPHPKTSALHALGLGLVVGLGLVFLAELLDVGVRSANEIADALGLRLIGRVAPSSEVELLVRPTSIRSEQVRLVRGALERDLENGVRTVLVTSGVADEGASVLTADLSVALARTGRRVAVVDLDGRAPVLDALFGVTRGPGVSDIVVGDSDLMSAARSVAVDTGSLAVVPAGAAPGDVGGLLGSEALAELLAELRERNDVVLLDTPPLLLVGDALAVTPSVDGVLLVAAVDDFRRSSADEVRRQLRAVQSPTLGVVVTERISRSTARRARSLRRRGRATYATG
jgi:capsular exopolysaccharide synthesis family protein